MLLSLHRCSVERAMDNLISLLKITEKKIMANYTLLFGTQLKRLVAVNCEPITVNGYKACCILYEKYQRQV